MHINTFIKHKEMNNKFNNQEHGHKLCPILNKKQAAEALGISVSQLTKAEQMGLILYDYFPGMTRPVYFRATLNSVAQVYKQWKAENPELYHELQL